MKKTIIVIMMVVCSMFISGQELDHGLITGFEVGYNLANQSIVSNRAGSQLSFKDLNNSLSLELKMGYRIGSFRIIGTYENTFSFLKIDSFKPLYDKYTIELSYTIDDFKFGFIHWCSHPVLTKSTSLKYFDDSGKRSVYVNYYKEF